MEQMGYSQLYLRDEELRLGFELLLAAHHQLDREVQKILTAQGLNLVHRPILYYIGRKPGLAGTELLEMAGLNKQSLSRHLAKLGQNQLIRHQAHPRDRRKIQYFLTEAGSALEQKLFDRQRQVIAQAYRQAGADAVIGFRTVLDGVSPKPSKNAK